MVMVSYIALGLFLTFFPSLIPVEYEEEVASSQMSCNATVGLKSKFVPRAISPALVELQLRVVWLC